MSDWQVGDMALCVDASKHANSRFDAPPPLVEGARYTVSAVHFGMQGLELREVSCAPAMCFKASRFRRIRPDEHQACEPEFVTLLRKSKQRVGA